MKFGVIGKGHIADMTLLLLQDLDYYHMEDIQNDQYDNLNDSSIIFVCNLTDVSPSGSIEYSDVNSVVEYLRHNNYNGFIVIRPTLPVGTIQKLGCFYFPYFSTQKDFQQMELTQTSRLIGINNQQPNIPLFKETFQQLLTQSKEKENIESDKVHFDTLSTVELVKFTTNTYFATKIGFFNEINQLCQKMDCEYQTVINYLANDKRINTDHTNVPGQESIPGFAGYSLMKDLITLSNFMERSQVTPIILKSVIGRNARIDRPTTVWTKPKKSEYDKNSLAKTPIMKLQQIANKYGINMDDCLEKNDMIDKIIKHTPTQIPNQVPSQIPNQVPSQIPNQVPTQIPRQIPTQIPNQRINPTQNIRFGNTVASNVRNQSLPFNTTQRSNNRNTMGFNGGIQAPFRPR